MSRALFGETPVSVLEVLNHAVDAFEAGGPRCEVTHEGIKRGLQLARSCGAVLGDAFEGRLAGLGITVSAPPFGKSGDAPAERVWTYADLKKALRKENSYFDILGAETLDHRPVAGHAPLRITCSECELVFCTTLDAWNKKRTHDCLCTTPVPKFATLYTRTTECEYANINTFLWTTRRFRLGTTLEEFRACRASLTLVCGVCTRSFVCPTSSVVCVQCPRGCP